MTPNIEALIQALAPYEEHYMQVQGVRSIVNGLEYHYRNALSAPAKLSLDAIHEITAYLGRLGQMGYFLQSDFMDLDEALYPAIKANMKYRHKYTAHRATDKPRLNDTREDISHTQILQPYSYPWKMDETGYPDLSQAMHGLQISMKKGDETEWHTFFIEEEHPKIMQEIEVCLRKKLSELEGQKS